LTPVFTEVTMRLDDPAFRLLFPEEHNYHRGCRI
jgi:hypothetical protein